MLTKICRSSLKLLLLTFTLSSGVSIGQINSPNADSVTIAVAPAYDSVSGFHRFLFGESYRKLWAAPVKVRVFHLNKEKGGLSIVQLGGGLQSKSIRLKDKAGGQWM